MGTTDAGTPIAATGGIDLTPGDGDGTAGAMFPTAHASAGITTHGRHSAAVDRNGTAVRAALSAADASCVFASVDSDTAAVDGNTAAALLKAAADTGEFILHAVDRQRTSTVGLAINGQGIAPGHMDALRSRQRRAVTKDQVHVAADIDACRDFCVLGDRVPASGQRSHAAVKLDCLLGMRTAVLVHVIERR